MKDLIYFSSVYTLIFTGYYVTAGFLTLIFPSTAFIGFAIFCGLYAVGSITGPFILSKINMRALFIISMFTFVLYIGLVSTYLSYLMLIGAGICGWGNSMIWLIQGIKTSEIKDQNSVGWFYGIFNTSVLIGNLIGLIILITGVPIRIMIWSMLGIAGVGAIMSIFVKFVTSGAGDSKDGINEPNVSFIQHILSVIKISKKCYWLIPMIITTAMGLNIAFQIVPRLINNSLESEQTKGIYTAAMFIAYGGASIPASIVAGKLFEKNWKYVVFPFLILQLLSLSLIMVFAYCTNELGYWIIIGFLQGITDYAMNNILNITFGRFEESETRSIFALYRCIYATFYILASIAVGYLEFQYVLLIMGILTILSVVGYCLHIKYMVSDIELQFVQSALPV